MVNEVILKTIKMMLKSGINQEQIKMQLSGYGLSDAEVKELIAKAGGESGKPAAGAGAGTATTGGEGSGTVAGSEPGATTGETESSSGGKFDADAAKKATVDMKKMEEIGAVHDDLTAAALTNQDVKLNMVHDKVDGLHDKVDAVSQQQAAFSSELVDEIKEELSDLKASTNALQTLLKKILETNREILLKMNKK